MFSLLTVSTDYIFLAEMGFGSMGAKGAVLNTPQSRVFHGKELQHSGVRLLLLLFSVPAKQNPFPSPQGKDSEAQKLILLLTSLTSTVFPS